MQINRLFEIVYLLMNRKSMTSKELAAHFEVSVRTILRDVDTLAGAGIPIYTLQGKGGGIAILDRFILNKAVISQEEQNQILFALQSLSATGSIATEGTLGRLKSLFQRTDMDWIEVDFSRWGKHGQDNAKFELLKNAIIQKRALTFLYASSYGETTSRKAYPLKLIFRARSWYLQAYCLTKEAVRTFKINRMRELVALVESFESTAFSIPPMETADGLVPELAEISLRFSPHLAYRVYDDFEDEDWQQNEDGSFTVSVRMPVDDWLYGYILSYGGAVEVLEPRSVRKGLVQKLEEIKSRHET